MIREAKQVISDGNARLLLLGAPDQFGTAVPEGMTVVPISCQSEGALEIYIEAVLPVPHLVIVGGSPMTRTLAELARALDWSTDLVSTEDFRAGCASERSMVIVATQGHGDEDMIERAVAMSPAYLGLVASRRRGEAVLGYLAERGVPKDQLDKVHAPAGLDLGKTTHEEMAVAILAELVQLRASGALADVPAPRGLARQERAATGRGGRPGLRDDGHGGRVGLPLEHDGSTYYFCCAGCRRTFEEDPDAYIKAVLRVIIASDFEVAEPVDKVWRFFDNIPQVASCLPGAELTKDLGDDKYEGRVAIRMGPVRMQFTGTADITERDEAAKRIVVHAAGADEKGRGQAAMVVGATLSPKGRGTKVAVTQDLQLSGAAAQYGRGMISDVSAILMRDFSATMQDRIERLERGESAEQIAAARRQLGPGLHDRRAGRADGADARLPPVLPPLPARGELTGSVSRKTAKGGPAMVLWWIGNAILLVVVLPVVIYLLNRVLAALERIRAASDDILAGGVALIGELQGVPDGLAVTDKTIEEVKVGAVRYAGSVAKLLG